MNYNEIATSGIKSDWFPSIIISIYMLITSITCFFLTVFFSEQLHFSGNQIGLLFSLQALTGVLASFPAGMGNDNISSRTLIVLSLIFQSITFILMGLFESFFPFLIIFVIWALTNWIFRLSLDVLFLKTKTNKSASRRIGFYQGWRFVGLFIGTISSGYLITFFDFKKSLIFVGIICLFLIIPSIFLSNNPIAKSNLSDYKADFSNKKVIFFALWLLIFASHWGAEQTCYGLFLRKNMNLCIKDMGYYMSFEFISLIIAVNLAGNKIAIGEGVKKIAILGLLASGLGNIGMTFNDVNVYISLSFRMLHGFGDGYVFLILYYGTTKLFSIERLGGNAGLINLSTMIGFILGSLIYSPIGEKFGYQHSIWISGLLNIILILPLISKRLQKLANN